MARALTIPFVTLAAAVVLSACSGVAKLASGGSNPIENQLLAEIAMERGDYAVAVEQSLKVAQQSDDPEFARRATVLASEYGYDAYGLAAAQRWVKLDKESPVAHAYLGDFYARRGSVDEAYDSFEKALGDVGARTDQEYAALASDFARNDSARTGLQIFERMAKAYPESAGIQRSLAEMAVAVGAFEQAVEAARAAISLRPDWYSTRVWLARLLLLTGERDSAFEQMAFALEMNPGVELELESVRLMAAAGETESALDRLGRLAERYPGEAGIPLIEASVYQQIAKLDEAEAIYVGLLANGVFRNESLWNLGLIAYEREDYEGAISLFGQVTSGDRLESATFAASQAHAALGDIDTAVQLLEDYAEFYPKRARAMLLPAAQIYAADGQYEAALAKTSAALEYQPWSVDLWLYRGSLFEQMGLMEDAVESFKTALQQAPDDPTTLNAYGYTLTIATRRYNEALDLISRALQLDPDNPAIMDSMGWVLFKKGDRDGARDWLEQAYALMPDPEIAAHLGEILWLEGEKDDATVIWESAAEDFPDNRPLRDTMQRFLN